MKKTLLLALVVSANMAVAAPKIDKAHRVGSIEITEITPLSMDFNKLLDDPTTPVVTPAAPAVDPIERTGKIISMTKDMVALGEVIYTLVQKGKPTSTTDYAPISVVPKDPTTKDYIDPFELENFSMPVQKVFSAKIKSLTGKDIVSFTYKVIYSYGGSYNGAGKYLTGVQIVPAAINVKFGWDFKMTMKLGGIMNHGTKADPVAGVLVAVKYSMSSWGRTEERNDTVHITGLGQLKSYGIQ